MKMNVKELLSSVIMWSIFGCCMTSYVYSKLLPESKDKVFSTEDYCMLESFQPRCMKNEAILMHSATYGRMRIGRCITEEEVAEFRSVFSNDSRYFGCSTDVLSTMDRKCSGKTECDIRQLDISNELSTKPCLSGLTVYLEVSYDCITVADEDRSCTVSVSNAPVHIIASSEPQRKCATKTQPWIIEAPVGQKIKITLIDFLSSQLSQNDNKEKKSCIGVVVDKAAKRNVSICVEGEQRTRYLYSSKAETLEIYYNTHEQKQSSNYFIQFALQLEAVGCSDLIAPEDAWLKRNDDSIVIGCYSNRQTWQLHCEGERWIGVFGNCSQIHLGIPIEEPELRKSDWSDRQILTVVAVGGLTLTICLAFVCTGIVCLRKFTTKTKKSQEYKVLDLQLNSSVDKRGIESMQSCMLPSAAIVNDVHNNCLSNQQMAPTYSVFVGDGDFNDNPTNCSDNNLLRRV